MHLEPNKLDYSDQENEINLFALWETLLTAKVTLVLVTLCCLAAATAAAFLLPVKYQSTLTASFADDGKSTGGLGALAGQFGGLADLAGVNLSSGGSSRDSALAYLKSRVFIEGFIDENKLLPVIFANKWDAAGKKWAVSDPSDAPTLGKAYDRFSKKILGVQFDKKTGLVTLTITWNDRVQAAAWANELIRRANANLREKAIAESQQSLGYLEKELQKTTVVEVQNTIYRVMESQIKTMMMANTQEQFAFKVIDPAAVMDDDDFAQPKRATIIALGGIAGLLFGVLIVFFRSARAKARNR